MYLARTRTFLTYSRGDIVLLNLSGIWDNFRTIFSIVLKETLGAFFSSVCLCLTLSDSWHWLPLHVYWLMKLARFTCTGTRLDRVRIRSARNWSWPCLNTRRHGTSPFLFLANILTPWQADNVLTQKREINVKSPVIFLCSFPTALPIADVLILLPSCLFVFGKNRQRIGLYYKVQIFIFQVHLLLNMNNERFFHSHLRNNWTFLSYKLMVWCWPIF